MDVIKTTSYDQHEILRNIIELHCPAGFELDPTYSKGCFYKGEIKSPPLKFDIAPQVPGVIKSDACDLPVENNSVKSLMFDPPFIVGNTKNNTGIIGSRFGCFKNIAELWSWYDKCIIEHYRVLKKNGVLVFKCQDTVSYNTQHLSHVFIINKAVSIGFYIKDLFILNAKARIIGHNHKKQHHARKYHCYFIVMIKK